jgi:hypothetical protein
MKKSLLLSLSILLLFCIPTIVPAEAQGKETSAEFLKEIDFLLLEEKLLTSKEGAFYSAEDFELVPDGSEPFTSTSISGTPVTDFVIRSKVSWQASDKLPKPDAFGYGFVFREQDPQNYLRTFLGLDGSVITDGDFQGRILENPNGKFAEPNAVSSATLTIAANGRTVAVLVDGKLVTKLTDIVWTEPGNLGYAILNGTPADAAAIRCKFEETELLVLK